MIYLDSSALVKLVLREPESQALYGFLESRSERVTSALSRVEVERAIRRACSSTDLARAKQVLERIATVPVGDAILTSAARLEPTTMRSLDAIHLATALSLPSLEAFVAYDARLISAADQHGCNLASPS